MAQNEPKAKAQKKVKIQFHAGKVIKVYHGDIGTLKDKDVTVCTEDRALELVEDFPRQFDIVPDSTEVTVPEKAVKKPKHNKVVEPPEDDK